VVDHTLDHLSECFCLAFSAPCYQGQLFNNLGFMGDTECSKQILKGTNKYPPNTNVWTKEDFAGSTLYISTYVRRQDCNHNFYCRFPTILDKGRQTDIILIQRCHLLALKSGGISCNALCNAHGISVSVCVRTERDPPCTLGDRVHCATSTGEDCWQ
jgi:hypothetical protein